LLIARTYYGTTLPDGLVCTSLATDDNKALLYAFDLLELDGADWRPKQLGERKAKLQMLLGEPQIGIQYSEHLEGDGAAIFTHACKLGFEGIVSKHRGHSYRSGPSKTWLKTKNPSAPGVTRFEDRSWGAVVALMAAKVRVIPTGI
jgi:bifunctional non-homologous end joining protein LigD